MRKIDAEHFDSRMRAAGGICEEELTEDFKDGVLTALDMLKAEPTVDDWIPVTEKLPPKGVDVIVTDIETVETYVGYYMGEGYWDTDNGPYRDRIVAWKPMPKPYKGE